MDKKTSFNLLWPAVVLRRLDQVVRRVGSGRAHATRSSRSKILLEAFVEWEKRHARK